MICCYLLIGKNKYNFFMDYNTIAPWYDKLYNWSEFEEEDRRLWEIIWEVQWKIIDLWCWTGQGVQILQPCAWQYIGVDISEKMLSIATCKYPETTFIHGKITDSVLSKTEPEIIIWLFGVMNYLSDEEIAHTIKLWKSVFLMDYRDGYHPICYKEWEMPKRQFTPSQFTQLHKWVLFENFDIYTNRPSIQLD